MSLGDHAVERLCDEALVVVGDDHDAHIDVAGPRHRGRSQRRAAPTPSRSADQSSTWTSWQRQDIGPPPDGRRLGRARRLEPGGAHQLDRRRRRSRRRGTRTSRGRVRSWPRAASRPPSISARCTAGEWSGRAGWVDGVAADVDDVGPIERGDLVDRHRAVRVPWLARRAGLAAELDEGFALERSDPTTRSPATASDTRADGRWPDRNRGSSRRRGVALRGRPPQADRRWRPRGARPARPRPSVRGRPTSTPRRRRRARSSRRPWREARARPGAVWRSARCRRSRRRR